MVLSMKVLIAIIIFAVSIVTIYYRMPPYHKMPMATVLTRFTECEFAMILLRDAQRNYNALLHEEATYHYTMPYRDSQLEQLAHARDNVAIKGCNLRLNR